MLIERARIAAAEGVALEIVTGNNDADAVPFLRGAERRLDAPRIANLRAHLQAWGGNSWASGLPSSTRGARCTRTPAGPAIPSATSASSRFPPCGPATDPMLAELRRRPRPLKGRCGGCADKSVCGGNPRILALQFTGHPWAEDPASSDRPRGPGTAGRGRHRHPIRRPEP